MAPGYTPVPFVVGRTVVDMFAFAGCHYSIIRKGR